MATRTIVRLADQNSGFLTNQSASTQYLTQSSASTSYLSQASASTVYSPKSSPDFINDISIKGTTPELNFLNPSGSVVSTVIHYGVEIPGEAEMIVTANPTDAYTKSSLYLYAGAAELITNIGSVSSLAAGVDKVSGFTVISGSNGTLLKVDTSGRVNTPLQPSFLAYRSGDQTGYNPSTQVNPIIYNATSYNVGANYNTSTGKFTAPVAGDYIFEAGTYQSTQVQQLWFVINDTRERSFVLDSSTNANVSGSGIVRLMAGDNIGICSWSGGSSNVTIYANSYHTFFRGRLLG